MKTISARLEDVSDRFSLAVMLETNAEDIRRETQTKLEGIKNDLLSLDPIYKGKIADIPNSLNWLIKLVNNLQDYSLEVTNNTYIFVVNVDGNTYLIIDGIHIVYQR